MARAALLAGAMLLPALLPLTGALPVPEPPLAPVDDWATVTAQLHAYALAFPALAKVQSVGKSSLGLDLWALTVTAPGNATRQRVLLDGDTHGNEQYGGQVLFVLLRELLEGYGTDPWATRTLATRNITFVPLVNPDGELKNQRKNHHEVDLNRNFPYGWGGPGSSGNPSSGNYRGPSPASEPEAQAMVVLADRAWDLQVTMHTGIRLLLWPWSTTYALPPDAPMFQTLGREWASAIGPSIPAKQGSGLYLASGTTFDYGYSKGFVSLTFEVSNVQGQPTYRASDLALQVQGMRFLLDHIEQMGADIAFTGAVRDGGEVVVDLANSGWGGSEVEVLAFQGGAKVDETEVRVPAGGKGTGRLNIDPDGGPVHLIGDYAELDQVGSQHHVIEADA